MLKNIFFEFTKKYNGELLLIETLWTEIEKRYSDTNRHYHTRLQLEYLISKENLLRELESL